MCAQHIICVYVVIQFNWHIFYSHIFHIYLSFKLLYTLLWHGFCMQNKLCLFNLLSNRHSKQCVKLKMHCVLMWAKLKEKDEEVEYKNEIRNSSGKIVQAYKISSFSTKTNKNDAKNIYIQ